MNGLKAAFFWILALFLILGIIGCGKQGAVQGENPTPDQGVINDFPNKEITIVVSNRAGGSNDLATRSIAPYFEKEIGVPVVVKNVEGGGGNIARAQVYKADPDGYTLLQTPMPSMAIGEIVSGGDFKTLELVPVFNLYGNESNVIIVPADSPIQSIEDLIEASKNKKLKASGSGTATNAVMGSIFLKNIGVNHDYISFDGGTESAQQVAGGHVDFGIASEVAAAGIQGNKIRAIASTGRERSLSFPDVPTLAELGYKDAQFEIIYGFWAPPGTPSEIVDKLAETFNKASENPQFREEAEKIGFTVRTMMPAEFSKAVEESYNLVKNLSEHFNLQK